MIPNRSKEMFYYSLYYIENIIYRNYHIMTLLYLFFNYIFNIIKILLLTYHNIYGYYIHNFRLIYKYLIKYI